MQYVAKICLVRTVFYRFNDAFESCFCLRKIWSLWVVMTSDQLCQVPSISHNKFSVCNKIVILDGMFIWKDFVLACFHMSIVEFWSISNEAKMDVTVGLSRKKVLQKVYPSPWSPFVTFWLTPPFPRSPPYVVIFSHFYLVSSLFGWLPPPPDHFSSLFGWPPSLLEKWRHICTAPNMLTYWTNMWKITNI